MKIAPNILAILAAMSVSGSCATLQGNLSRQDYVTTNQVLETVGGKWNRKLKCHVFSSDAQTALATVLEAPTAEIYTAKEKKNDFQFFGTPEKLADELVKAAEYHFPYNPPETILEPSAGNGSLVKAIHRLWPMKNVDCYELMPENRSELAKLSNITIRGDDFLKCDSTKKYELIFANPPFQKHQDIQHVRRMYELLDESGVLVSVTSNHWRHASHKIDKEFKSWLESLDAEIYEIESGAFKESGTMVSANYVVIQK